MNFLAVNSWLLYICIVFFFCISMGIQIMLARYLQKAEKEVNHLEEKEAIIFKECIEDYIREEAYIRNLVLFTEKRLKDLKIGKFTLINLKHLSGQSLLFGIFLSGIGAFFRIIEGRTLGEILPYYILSFLGLYCYFSLTGWIDYEEKIKGIKDSLMDFLENKRHSGIYGGSIADDIEGKEEILLFGKEEEKELRELLQEILA